MKYVVEYIGGGSDYREVHTRKGIPMVNRLGQWVEVALTRYGYKQVQPVNFSRPLHPMSAKTRERFARIAERPASDWDSFGTLTNRNGKH